jgi:hypothetical protein
MSGEVTHKTDKNCGVHQVCRKMAMLILQEYEEEEPYMKNAAVESLEIIDPTFEAPKINLNCRWQCELLDHLTTAVSTHVISTCMNKNRLKRYVCDMRWRLEQ